MLGSCRQRWKQIFAAAVENNDGVLQDGTGESGLTVLDAVAGRIPILWTAEAERAGIKREDYKK